jgi:hypothetical protein
MRCKPTNYEALQESELIATWDDLRPDVIIVSHVVTVKYSMIQAIQTDKLRFFLLETVQLDSRKYETAEFNVCDITFSETAQGIASCSDITTLPASFPRRPRKHLGADCP